MEFVTDLQYEIGTFPGLMLDLSSIHVFFLGNLIRNVHPYGKSPFVAGFPTIQLSHVDHVFSDVFSRLEVS